MFHRHHNAPPIARRVTSIKTQAGLLA